MTSSETRKSSSPRRTASTRRSSSRGGASSARRSSPRGTSSAYRSSTRGGASSARRSASSRGGASSGRSPSARSASSSHSASSARSASARRRAARRIARRLSAPYSLRRSSLSAALILLLLLIAFTIGERSGVIPPRASFFSERGAENDAPDSLAGTELSSPSDAPAGTAASSLSDEDAAAVAASPFSVHFIDVGQGDSALVLCGGQAMLIDGGTSEHSDTVYRYLEKLGLDYLDYIVCSHPHADHAGGLAGALHYARAGIALSPVADYDNSSFEKFTAALSEQGVAVTVPAVGDTFALGSAVVEVLGPTDWLDDNVNNDSLALRISYGDVSFLFTGDAEQEEEQLLMENNYDALRSTVWKVSHHGSANGASYAFIDAVSPDYAVISCEKGNSYGHPHEETLDLLRGTGTTLFRTDVQGDVVCTSDGQSLSFYVSRNANADVWKPGT